MKIQRRIINIDNENDDCVYELRFVENVYYWRYFFRTPIKIRERNQAIGDSPPLYLDSKRNLADPPTKRELAHVLKFEEKDLCE